MVLWQIARMFDNMIDIIPKPQETGEAFFGYHGSQHSLVSVDVVVQRSTSKV